MATRSLGTLTLDLLMKIGGYVAPLDQAARKTKKNTDDMKNGFNGVKLAVIALGSAAGVAFAALAKASINAADDLSKTSQQVGFSVESLSALKYTAGLAGVELEGLSGSLLKFNKNIADAANKGSGPAADAFADLQIELRGTDGQLKSTEELFTEVADKMAMLEDGALKTALAQDLLGRSGAKLIPLLNGGAEGLRDGADEAKRLGQIIGTDAAKAAEQFNDNLSRLKASVTGVSNVVAMELIDDISELSDLFTDPAFQDGVKVIAEGLAGVAKGAGAAIKEISSIKNSLFGFDKTNVDQIKAQIELVQGALDDPVKRVRLFDRNGFIPWVLGYESEAELEQKLKDLNSLLEKSIVVDVPKNVNNESDKKDSVNLTAEQIEKNRKLREEQEKALEEAKKFAEQQAEQAKKLQEDYDVVIGSMEKQIALYGDTTRVAEIRYDLEKGYLEGITEKQKQHYINLAKQLDLMDQQRELMAELDEFDWSIAPANDESDKWLKFAEDAAERINESFSDAWMNIDKGFTGLRDGIVDGFKRMLAEMAHEAITKPIIMQIQQAVTGVAGPGGAGAFSPAGLYAGAALAVAAGLSAWERKQDEKFEKMTAEFRQGNQSIGTLLGEANKKSQSISETIKSLESMSDDVLGVNHSMLMALLDIRDGISGVAAGFARQFGVNGVGDFSNIKTGTFTSNSILGFSPLASGVAADLLGDEIGGFIDGVVGGISKAIYNKKKKIIDSGIEFTGQALADILTDGVVDAMAYADVQTRKRVLGITTSNKLKTKYADLDEQLLDQFGDVFAQSAEALELAAGVFGIEFDKYLDLLKIDPQKLSLKGLEGDALVAEIESFFSSTLDNWAEVVLGVASDKVPREISGILDSVLGTVGFDMDRLGSVAESATNELSRGAEVLKQFQEVGEGAFETMIRLAGETVYFTEVADKLGLNFNALGLAAVESVQYLADAAGGFDKLTKSLGNYASKFLSDAEQVAFATKIVNEEFGKLGLAVPKTREEFSALVQGINLTTEAGREQFAALMGLVDVTDSYISALDKETKAKEDAAKAAIGASFNSLTRAVQAERDIIDKMNRDAMDAIQKSLSGHQAVANSLTAALDSMAIQSSKAELMARRAAQAQLVVANAVARAGGPLPAAGQLDAALGVLSRPSEQLFATWEEYARDFYVTQQSLRELQEAAVGQVSIDEQNLRAQEAYHAAELDRLDKLVGYYQDQIDALNNIDNSVIGVADAVNKLNLALRAVGVDPAAPVALVAAQQSQAVIPVKKSVPLLDVSMVDAGGGARAYSDLLSEVKALRLELESSQFEIAKSTLHTKKILERWDGDGLPPEREEAES